MITDNNPQKEIIVILGAGRTGTSLLTKLLVGLGMSISPNLIPLSEQNTEGFFEDKEIVTTHINLLSFLKSHPYLPLNKDFLKTKGISSFINRLLEITHKNINSTKTLWGFKDPRTLILLPLWMRVFNSGKIIPRYILTVRDPRSVVESMHKQYNDSTEIAELSWLLRNCEALYQTGGNCFVVHYEDWFTENASVVAKHILSFTGLDRFWDKEKNVKEAIGKIVKPNLNRAVYNDYVVRNRYVIKLYDALLNCRGDQFDRQALMDVVMECRKAMDEFSGWAIEAQGIFKQKRNLQSSNKSQFNHDSAKLVLEANKRLQDLKDSDDENKNFRIKISMQSKELKSMKEQKEQKEQKIEQMQQVMQNKNKQLKKIKIRNKTQQEKIFTLRTSTSFQLGQILINAVAKPGKNTILLPFYLARTLLSSRVV
ncbi:MAG: hypothetical protein JKY62_14070 [Desulfocapsa sp.]|nr:hypothetical protein [Desulfocapsa sp.]